MRASLTTPEGIDLEPMGWTGKHRTLAKLVTSGARLVVWPVEEEDLEWVVDATEWWEANSPYVHTDDHRLAGPDPDAPVYLPSVWRGGGDGFKVVLLEEVC